MSHLRYVPRISADLPSTAFGSAEEAWFWFVRCQQIRREGAQLGKNASNFARPCDPDDIYRAIMSLSRQRRLQSSHLSVLGKFGLAGRPPDARRSDEVSDSRLWDESLDRLSAVLRAKGIVA